MNAPRQSQLIRGAYGDDPHVFEPRIQRIVDTFFLDKDGLVIAAIKGPTLRPYTAADMHGVPLEKTIGRDLGAPHKYKLLLMNYEETGMAHSDYLMAMLEKYKATGQADAKRRARRAFQTLRRLADTVAETNPYGRGWWPKPYGGMKDLNEMFETSIDQTIKVVLALAQYEQELATRAERHWCRGQVRAMADWWIRHHFTTRLGGNCCWWDLHEAPHSAAALLYLVRQAIAWTPGPAPRPRRDAWEHLWKHRDWITPRRHHAPHECNLAIECVRRLHALDPGHRSLWQHLRDVLMDHSIRRTNPRTGTSSIRGWGRHNTGVRTACSAALVQAWTGESRYAQVAWQQLKVFNREVRFYEHDQTQLRRKPDAISCWRDALSGHHYVAWLLAYWRLRNVPAAGSHLFNAATVARR